jgi:hypothetical protein
MDSFQRSFDIQPRSLSLLAWVVGRNNSVVRIAKRIDMHKSKMGHIEETLNLAACEAEDVQARTRDLLKAGFIPMRHRWNVRLVVRSQARPDQTIKFPCRIRSQMEFLRNGILWLGGDHVATPLCAETKSVIGAGNALAVMLAHAERRTAVRTQIVGHDHPAVDTIDDQQLVQQLCRYRAVDYFARQCNRVPVSGKLHPIIGIERAIEWKIDYGRCGLNDGDRSHVPY